MSRQLRSGGPTWVAFNEIYGSCMYCYGCGKFYKADKDASCCGGYPLLHFIPPIWIPKRLIVLTIELYDHV